MQNWSDGLVVFRKSVSYKNLTLLYKIRLSSNKQHYVNFNDTLVENKISIHSNPKVCSIFSGDSSLTILAINCSTNWFIATDDTTFEYVEIFNYPDFNNLRITNILCLYALQIFVDGFDANASDKRYMVIFIHIVA